MRALSSISVLASVLLVAIACSDPAGPGEGNGNGGGGDFTKVTVAPGATTVATGSTVQLHLTGINKSGQSATPTKAVWTTSNTKIATVGPDGLVTGYAIGTVQITAQSGSLRDSSTVTVINAIHVAIPCIDPVVQQASKAGGDQKIAFSKPCRIR